MISLHYTISRPYNDHALQFYGNEGRVRGGDGGGGGGGGGGDDDDDEGEEEDEDDE